MKQISITLIALLVLTTAFGQVQAIKDTCQEVEGRMSNSFYNHSEEQEKEIRNILNLDVLKYFNLQETYNTELKIKNYKASTDYKQKLNELIALKKDLCSKTYYLDFDPAYYEKNNTFKYDLSTKTFTLTNEIYKDEMYNGVNVLQFDNIILTLINGITIKRQEYESGDVDFIRQKINFKIIDENLAEKIEDSRSEIRVLFVFKFSNSINYPGKFFGRNVTVPGLGGKISKVILYNSSNGKILKTYQ